MQESKVVSVIFIVAIFIILDMEKTPYAENNYLSTNPYGVYWKGNAFYFNNNATGDINKPKQLHNNDNGEQLTFMFKIPPDYINRFSNSPDIWIKLLRPSIDNPNCELELIPSFIKITRDKWEKVEKFGPDTDENGNSSAVPIKLVGSKPLSFDIFRIVGDKLKLQPRDEVTLGLVYHRTGKRDACEENYAIQDIQIKWGYGEELF